MSTKGVSTKSVMDCIITVFRFNASFQSGGTLKSPKRHFKALLWPAQSHTPTIATGNQLLSTFWVTLEPTSERKKINPRLPEMSIFGHWTSLPGKNGLFCQCLTTSITKPCNARGNPALHAGRATLRPNWEGKIFNPGLPKMSIFGHWTSLHGQNDYFCECLTTKIWKPWTARANPALHAGRATLWPN